MKKTGTDVGNRLQAIFGKLPVVDACVPLRLQPMPCDVESAKQKDPENCVFARAARRQYNATKVVFWKRHAYVDLVGPDGIRRIERFTIRSRVLSLIEAFDRGQPIETGRAFELSVPNQSEKLGAQKLRFFQRRRTNSGQIVDKAIVARRNLKKAELTLSGAEERLRSARTTTTKVTTSKMSMLENQEQAARKSVNKARETAHRLTEAASKVSKRVSYPGRTPKITFDLSVRSGQHHYKFIGA